jgi:hypothetical protein
MRVSARRLFPAACAVLLSLSAAAASAQTVDEIVAKHIQARGGYDKLKAIQTIKISRTFATNFSASKVEIFKKRPNLLRIEQTPKGQPAPIPRGINAEGAWDMVQGKMTMRPERVAVEGRELDADFDGLLVDWKGKGHTVTLEGKETIGGSEAHKLKVVTKGGTERFVYIDTKTFMETGQSGRWLTPQVDPKTKAFRYMDSIWIFSDFRDVDGVKFPFSIDEDRTQYAGANAEIPITTSIAIYTDKIELNVPMADTLFAPPSAAGAGDGKW